MKRIFGPDGPDFESDSHLVNASYTFASWLDVTGFVYLLDFDNSAVNSTNTYGSRLTGTLPVKSEHGLSVAYDASYAFQTDARNNPASFDVHYFGLDGRVQKKDVGYVGVGYELLSSDHSNGFRTPLATLHKFNGWADVFLGTPASGLQDLYVYIGVDLPWNLKGKLVFHQFWSHRKDTEFGSELDLLLSKQISRNWSILGKSAFYEGDGPFADRTKFWIQTTFQF